ncbi:MAG TPA: tocopherol cyclase family protein [Solirubrobacteraceae bacterium]
MGVGTQVEGHAVGVGGERAVARAHGVVTEGYFWRFTDARAGRVVIALCGINRGPGETWATLGLGGHPGGFTRWTDARPAGDDPDRLAVHAGDGTFAADADGVALDLGPDARLEVRLHDVRTWPRRPFGGSGAAHALPGLPQYWHPHVLGGRAEGRAIIDGEEIDLAGWDVYAEKNWGASFPDRWWWGSAQGFARPDVCVAFAGGPLAIGPARFDATALVVQLGPTLIRLGDPLLSPMRADVGEEHWRLRGRGPRWSVEVDAGAPLGEAHVLPVPLAGAGHSVPGALEHLGGRLRVAVRRRGRLVFEGESHLAGLEHGGIERAAAELRRRESLAVAL